MPMQNFLEYSKNYRKTTGGFWNYYRDESDNNSLNDDKRPTFNYNADPITNSESFKYKSSITGKTSNVNNNTEREHKKTKKNLEIVVPLKYLSNFWRTLDMPLINFQVSLTLTRSENCVLTDVKTQTEAAAQGENPRRERIDAPTNATFKITETKLYVPVVTLSTKDDNNLLEQLKSRFERTIK